MFNDRNGILLENALCWIAEHIEDAYDEEYGLLGICEKYIGMEADELQEIRESFEV